MEAFLVGIAAVAGVLVGFWLRGADARAAIASLEQSNRELRDALARARTDVEKSAGDMAARAGFESLAAERERTIGQITAEREDLRAQMRARSEQDLTQATRVKELEIELRNEKEKSTQIDEAKIQMAHQFEELVGEIIAKKSKVFSEIDHSDFGDLLTPLREQILEFRAKIESAQVDSNAGVNKIETLIGSLGSLNQQLAEEARNLSTALRGSSKTRGDWGEFILRDLLEKAGLREGDQFTLQQSFRDAAMEEGVERGSKQTDVVVHLPGGRHLVIDCKVPVNAYMDSVSAEREEDRAAAAHEHLKLVRNHVASVAQANYHGLPGIPTPDFVILFVPIEPGFLEALKGDPELWVDAYTKGVLLSGPTTLLYVIRIVSILWRQEDQNRAVRELTDQGTRLYAKFAEFITDMDGLGEGLRSTSAQYDAAKKKLSNGSGSLANQFEDFKQLCAQPKIARPAQPVPFQWAPQAERSGQLFESENDGVDLENDGAQLELAAVTNGYHHDRAEDLEIEESPYSNS